VTSESPLLDERRVSVGATISGGDLAEIPVQKTAAAPPPAASGPSGAPRGSREPRSVPGEPSPGGSATSRTSPTPPTSATSAPSAASATSAVSTSAAPRRAASGATAPPPPMPSATYGEAPPPSAAASLRAADEDQRRDKKDAFRSAARMSAMAENQPSLGAGALRSSFGGGGGTAAYLGLRRALLDEGRLPPSIDSLEELTNAFEEAVPAISGAPQLRFEGADLPGRSRTALLRVVLRHPAAPPRPGAVAVVFNPALVAEFRRVGATASEGGATALFEIELTPRAAPPPHAAAGVDADPLLATLQVAGDAGAAAAVPVEVRLSDLRRPWRNASASLRLPGIAVELGEALSDHPSLARWRELRRNVAELAVAGEARPIELQRLVDRAASLATPAPADNVSPPP
jgi:hypothetical protein